MKKIFVVLGVVAILFFILLAFREEQETLKFQEEPEFKEARERMVERDLKGRDITDKKVLEVMAKIPRHLFVSEDLWDQAYEDHPLPIDEGQTISQPYVVALMTQSLELKGGERVLEIGTGSGYQAAVLAEIVSEVYTIEIREKLAKKAEKRLKELGYKNVKVKWGDGYFGWEEYAPYDAIIVTCAANHIPPALLEQLKDRGRLIIPLGSTTYFQTLTLVKKHGDDFETIQITSVRFVPMIGEIEKRPEGEELKEEKEGGLGYFAVVTMLIVIGLKRLKINYS